MVLLVWRKSFYILSSVLSSEITQSRQFFNKKHRQINNTFSKYNMVVRASQYPEYALLLARSETVVAKLLERVVDQLLVEHIRALRQAN